MKATKLSNPIIKVTNNHRQEFFDQIEVCKKNVIFFIKSNSIKKLKLKLKIVPLIKLFHSFFCF